MKTAHIVHDPNARSLRGDIISQDMMDTLAHALQATSYTSAEVHRDADLQDILHGNGRVVGHAWSTSPRYHPRWEDPD